MAPYRLLAVMPRETPAPSARAVIARRDAGRVSMPLGVIVVCFFLPAAKDCSAVVSPADLAFGAIPWFLWLVPTYIGAGLLLASIVRARLQHAAPRGIVGTLVAACLLGACTMVTIGMMHENAVPILACNAVGIAGTLFFLVKGLRRRGWMRFFHLTNAWLVGSLPIAVLNALLGEYWGAHLFLFALGAFVVLRAVTIAAMVRAKCESESLARLDIRGPSLRV